MKIGTMISEIGFSNLPLLFRRAGLDFFILDAEHGGFDYREISGTIVTAKLAGIECVVRLPDNARRDITRFLDMGADGLLLPMTDCAEDIRRVVSYAKYAPLGRRGISTMRAHTLYNPPPLAAYMESANERVKVFAQIETRSGVEHAIEILSVEGVSGALIGPNDLSCDYGCLQSDGAGEIFTAIETVAAAARDREKLAGIITANPNYIQKGVSCGMEYFSVGSELSMLSAGAKKIFAMFR